MQFSTPVDLPSFPFRLTPQSRGLMLGSCFAQHMGARLEKSLPPRHLVVNPFGVIYHPLALSRAIACMLRDSPFPHDIFFRGNDGLWHSWWHAGECSAPTREECVAKAEAACERGRKLLRDAQFLVLTLGTDRGYHLKEMQSWGNLVSNCHKMPSTLFVEESDALSTLLAEWQPLLRTLHTACPHLHIIWTVSPYRYAKYGMHASQLAKAKLHLLVEELMRVDAAEVALHHELTTDDGRTSTSSAQSMTEWQHYFPAYEILLDELRDYRFYAADMLHPSEQAVDYIWEKFRDATFSSELSECNRALASIRQALSHRPLHPESEEYARFQAKTQERVVQFEARYGFSPC